MAVFKQPLIGLYLSRELITIVLLLAFLLLQKQQNFLHRHGYLFVINRIERMWEGMAEREKGPTSSPSSPSRYYCALLLHCSSRLGKNICRSPSPPPVAHQIQYRTECEPASASASTASAASFVLVTFYCPWDTKVLVQGTARPLWPQCTARSTKGWVGEDKMMENLNRFMQPVPSYGTVSLAQLR